ncbi:hypothetical protein M3P21_17280 [Ruegeria sp. 2012CJ41-6]|uniref:Uncharacterized protein n=1 Tax=Ruegeria spongiae TaxID=2942209 RepID=A0ABT0Q5Z1_9RHOB|nr:hypothetical protein [Ruegeria spongiae]MCL6285284.1 hypothetical protein [Ruegeria spongiae]
MMGVVPILRDSPFGPHMAAELADGGDPPPAIVLLAEPPAQPSPVMRRMRNLRTAPDQIVAVAGTIKPAVGQCCKALSATGKQYLLPWKKPA